MKHKFVLGVDLDGVVADYVSALKPIAAEWLGVEVGVLTDDISYSFDEWNLQSVGKYSDLHRFAVVQRGLYSKMGPIAGAPSALRRLSQMDVRIRIITNRLYIKYYHVEAVSQTIAWLDQYGIPYWDLCFMKDKSAVAANLYLEDSPENIETLQGAGCSVLTFTQPYNRHLKGVTRVDGWGIAESRIRDAVLGYRTEQRVANASKILKTSPVLPSSGPSLSGPASSAGLRIC